MPCEPLSQARAAEGVQAVEEGERLIEDVCADLMVMSVGARASPDLEGTY